VVVRLVVLGSVMTVVRGSGRTPSPRETGQDNALERDRLYSIGGTGTFLMEPLAELLGADPSIVAVRQLVQRLLDGKRLFHIDQEGAY